MAANIKKLKICFLALGTFIKSLLTMRVSVWVLLVAFLVFVLFSCVVSCSNDKSVTRAVVGSTEYNGHNYLVFRALDNHRTLAVVHDPDCVCNYIEVVPEEIVE